MFWNYALDDICVNHRKRVLNCDGFTLDSIAMNIHVVMPAKCLMK